MRRVRTWHRDIWGHALAALAVGLAGHGAVAEPVGPKLPPELRRLLQQEMVAIRAASHDILDALIEGDSRIVAERAQAIHDSFIMQRSLSEADKRVLEETLPASFVALDRRFHETAAEVAAAARAGERGAQHAGFRRLLETCSSCHAAFAGARFPGFEAE
ncbi:MAG: cytochrome c [Gammaproteobacteria bacterium]|nr:cytochrome c [Gammaproteobacteria bacterium]NIR83484.1 cytochrome c [Gammaproteobacteria bacterium]NIR91406.1 cytochrome c [Gammaproteobacteria bacterium]NIU04646.1 cytochrome c [Gammaproteobacteria bacterium]NIV51688.1 cytochrome c [Gammaproteobacteria bacterium]